jgi:hypothetical protein
VQIENASAGRDVVGASIALHKALMLEGVEMPAAGKSRRFARRR